MSSQPSERGKGCGSFPEGSLAAHFRDHLQKFCRKVGFEFFEVHRLDPPQLQIYFSRDFPMWISIDVDAASKSALLIGVVRTYGFAGARTDYHDLMSLLWAAEFRSWNHASVRLIDVPHPAVPGELWGRYVFFEKQPPASYISLECPNYKLIEHILMLSSLAGYTFSTLYKASRGDADIERCEDADEWAREVGRCVRWKVGVRGELTNSRRNPDWDFYRRNDHGVTAFRLQISALSLLAAEEPRKGDIVLDGQDSYLVKTGPLKNTVTKSIFEKAAKLLQAFGVTVGQLNALLQRETVLFLPTESHLICATEKGLLAIETEGGLRSFQNAESLLRKRHQKEATVLHSSTCFQWSGRIVDERFEELVLELLQREPGVRWVRRVGSARASDGERDLIVEWQLPPAPWEAATEDHALVYRRIVVQCKAYTGSINRAKVGDVPGTVDLHSANGYLLVAHPRITPPLLDYLTKVPAKRNIWADWWTQPEIEERLRSNLDITSRYPDLFRVTSIPE